MEYGELMADFVGKLGLDGAEPDAEGAWHFEFDGMSVSFLEVAETGELLTWADVGEPPPEGRERLYRTLLGAMFMGEGTLGASFSIARDDGRICLHRVDLLAGLDFDRFMANLERFVNVLEEWRGILADFREVAPEQAREAELEAEQSRVFGLGGFLQA